MKFYWTKAFPVYVINKKFSGFQLGENIDDIWQCHFGSHSDYNNEWETIKSRCGSPTQQGVGTGAEKYEKPERNIQEQALHRDAWTDHEMEHQVGEPQVVSSECIEAPVDGRTFHNDQNY